MPHRRHPHLYQINTWVWLEDLSRQAGRRVTLGDVPDAEWDHLAGLGFDFVYLMGVWRRSPIGRYLFRTDPRWFPLNDSVLPGWTMADIVGSPYSIQEYAPDPRIGSWDELDAVRARLCARGMGLVLDFVPNHTGFDHPWVEAHPEYFVQGTQDDFRRDPAAFWLSERPDGGVAFIARGRDPYFPPWSDVAQLNYFNPGLRAAMLEQLRLLAGRCDGLRCDMAMLVLNDIFPRTWGGLVAGVRPPAQEFWTEAIRALPDLVWIAEVYWDMEWRMQQLGFHFTYDKRLYDRLHGGTPRDVRDHFAAEPAYQDRLVRFLENHDEPRSVEAFGAARVPGLAVLMGTAPGMRFYHHGQFEGRRIRPPVQFARVAGEPADEGLRAFYERLLQVVDQPIFHDGDWRRLDPLPAGDGTFDRLVAWRWRLGDALAVAAINLAGDASHALLPVGEEVDPSGEYLFDDVAGGDAYRWQGASLTASGLYVRLEGHQAHLFMVSRSAGAPA